MRLSTLLLAGLSTGLAGAQTPSESWSRFRGPNGSGTSTATDLPSAIGPDKNVRWRRDFAPGFSSPVLYGSRLFATGLEDEELKTYCLDASSGAQLWSATTPRKRTEPLDERNHPAAASPVADAERVVVFFADYGLVAFDHAGKQLWSKEIGPFNNVYGMGASPILHEGRVFLACDQQVGSYLLAVDATTGEELWRSARPWAKSSHCTPIVLDTKEGGAELILPGSFYLDAYDLKTGERRWWVPGLCFEMKSVPIEQDGLIFVNGYGSPMNQPGNQITIDDFDKVIKERDANKDGLVAQDEMPENRASSWFGFVDLNLDKTLDQSEWSYLQDALASKNGMHAIRQGGQGAMDASSVKWSYHRSVPQLPSPLIYEDVLYMLADGGGLITTFRPQDGELIERGRIEEAIDTYYASPVAADGRVWLASEHGFVLALPQGGSLEPLFVSEMNERIYATPAFSQGRIYLRTEFALYCFEESDE